MKNKRSCIFALVFWLLGIWLCAPVSAATAGYALPDGEKLHAESALLINLGSSSERDVVLYEKEADEVHAPGAMMRFMVLTYALVRAQEKGLDIDTATGTYTMEMFNRYVAGTGVPTANMAFGETWTLRDLMIASFIQNASDAVTTLASALEDSVAAYVKGMNDLAKEIGCDYTHYANLTGLDSLAQYTTARDMYRIIRFGQTLPIFEEIASTRQHTVQPVSGGTDHVLVSVNNMQQSSSMFYYEPLVFGRTGLSEREGRTYAGVARDSGYEYLAVVLACPERDEDGNAGVHFSDSRQLFRWAFNSFSYDTLLAKSELLASVKVNLSWSTDRVNAVPADSFSTVVENQLEADQVIKKVTLYYDQIDAPVEKGTPLGKVELIVNVDQKIGEVELVAADNISRNWLLYIWSGFRLVFSSVWFWMGLVLLVVLLVGYIVLTVTYNRRRQRERIDRR